MTHLDHLTSLADRGGRLAFHRDPLALQNGALEEPCVACQVDKPG